MQKPVPTPVHWDRGFWEAAAEGRLVAQRCGACDHLQHYPRPACASCLGRDLSWEELSGTGTLYSFTVVRVPVHPAFRQEVPFVLVDVQLDEGVRMISRLTGAGEEEPAIGDRVRVEFQDAAGEGLRLPYFRLDRAA